MNQTLKSWITRRTLIKTLKNTNLNPNKFSSNQGQSFIQNHSRKNNLIFICFNYQTINTILSKWVSVQNQNRKIKPQKKNVIDAYKS